MTTPLTPEGAKNWFHTLYGLTERSTPITMIFLILMNIVGYVVTKREISRLHDVNLKVFSLLETKNEQLLKLAMDCKRE